MNELMSVCGVCCACSILSKNQMRTDLCMRTKTSYRIKMRSKNKNFTSFGSFCYYLFFSPFIFSFHSIAVALPLPMHIVQRDHGWWTMVTKWNKRFQRKKNKNKHKERVSGVTFSKMMSSVAVWSFHFKHTYNQVYSWQWSKNVLFTSFFSCISFYF